MGVELNYIPYVWYLGQDTYPIGRNISVQIIHMTVLSLNIPPKAIVLTARHVGYVAVAEASPWSIVSAVHLYVNLCTRYLFCKLGLGWVVLPYKVIDDFKTKIHIYARGYKQEVRSPTLTFLQLLSSVEARTPCLS